MGYSAIDSVNGNTPNSGRNDQGYVAQTVDPNSLVRNQLVGLLDSNSDYIQQARNQSAQQANSRGLLNSSIAAGAGQGAAIGSAMPIANQDAQTYGAVGAANAAAENAYLQEKMKQKTAALAGAGAYAAANVQKQFQAQQLAEQAREFDASQASKDQQYNSSLDWQKQQYNTGLDWQKQQYGTDWQHQQTTMQQQNQMNQQNYLYTGLFSNVMNNPDMWSDPQAAMGFANYFASNFNDLWSSMFGGGALPATSTP